MAYHSVHGKLCHLATNCPRGRAIHPLNYETGAGGLPVCRWCLRTVSLAN